MSKTVVGFDFGDRVLKMAVVAGGAVKKAVYAELPDNMMRDGVILSYDAMADFIKQTAKENGIGKSDAAVVLSDSLVYSRNVTVPPMTDQQLRFNLPYEFRDYLTEEKNRYFFDYIVRDVYTNEDGEPQEMDLFACAISKSVIADYRTMFRRAGFRLKYAVPEEYAIGMVIKNYINISKAEPADYCLVDLGHDNTRLYVFHDERSDLRRGIELGVGDLDERISRNQDIDVHIARVYRAGNYNDVFTADYAIDLYGSVAAEILKAVNFYNYNNREAQLGDIYLCGGGTAIEPFVDQIRQVTGLQVHNITELLPAMPDDDFAGLFPGAFGCAVQL